MWAALLPLVLWLAVIAACVYEDGMNLFQWMGCFSRALERPFSVRWTAHTLKFMMGSVFLYGCGIALYYSGRENRRPGEEYGSAKWGDPKELNRKYIQSLNRGILVELVKAVWVHKNGEITVDFNFADEFQRILDYIECEHSALTPMEQKAAM